MKRTDGYDKRIKEHLIFKKKLAISILDNIVGHWLIKLGIGLPQI